LEDEEVLKILLLHLHDGDPLFSSHADALELFIIDDIAVREDNFGDSKDFSGSCKVSKVGDLLKEGCHHNNLTVLLLVYLDLL
jgi:hypothetical protein